MPSHVCSQHRARRCAQVILHHKDIWEYTDKSRRYGLPALVCHAETSARAGAIMNVPLFGKLYLDVRLLLDDCRKQFLAHCTRTDFASSDPAWPAGRARLDGTPVGLAGRHAVRFASSTADRCTCRCDR